MLTKEQLIDYIYSKQRETRILSNRTKKLKNKRLKYYDLQKHVDKFLESDNEYYHRVIMMPGLRGVGKTTILYQLYDYLTSEMNIVETDVFFLDMHDLRTVHDGDIKEMVDLYLEDSHHATISSLEKKVFIFVDEAQLDKNWAKYAKLIHDKSVNIFMIVTGSSAITFEVNTDATRRIKKEQIYPLNFREYLLLKHDIQLSENNFKDLILKGDTESIKQAMEDEKRIKKELIKLDNDPNIELKQFLHSKGFPFALDMDETDAHRYTNDVIERIVSHDLKQIHSFNVSDESIMQIIAYLATKKPGKTSNTAIAQALQLNSRTVKSILSALEKTQLIFNVTAFGSAGKMLKKPKQHLFLTPSLKSAQNYRVGRYDLNHEKCFATLAENLVGSALNRLGEESQQSLGLFYDANKKGVDFIVKHLERITPIEVGIGKKTKSQLTIAKNRYKTDYGILVSNRTSNIEYEKGILYIPLLTFALI